MTDEQMLAVGRTYVATSSSPPSSHVSDEGDVDEVADVLREWGYDIE